MKKHDKANVAKHRWPTTTPPGTVTEGGEVLAVDDSPPLRGASAPLLTCVAGCQSDAGVSVATQTCSELELSTASPLRRDDGFDPESGPPTSCDVAAAGRSQNFRSDALPFFPASTSTVIAPHDYYNELFVAQNNTIALLMARLDDSSPSLKRLRLLERQVKALQNSVDALRCSMTTSIQEKIARLPLLTVPDLDAHLAKHQVVTLPVLEEKLLRNSTMQAESTCAFLQELFRSFAGASSPAAAVPLQVCSPAGSPGCDSLPVAPAAPGHGDAPGSVDTDLVSGKQMDTLSTLENGEVVRLCGLQSSTYNGLLAEVCPSAPSADRIAVKLQTTGKKILVQRSHVEPLIASERCSAKPVLDCNVAGPPQPRVAHQGTRVPSSSSGPPAGPSRITKSKSQETFER